ncbi:MAG: hypothetical protein JSU70_10985 [Phycisphaerales bacterium]|nr:MAG: hypothetical protein JSU70_10985 [Phycisphaerales bacterium]
MKHKKEDVDRLLQRNADEQLADFDWERLSAGISSRLDKVQRRKTSVVGFGAVIRIAAGMAAAAAIVLIAVTVMQRKPAHTPAETSGTAVVKLSERQGTASVDIAALTDAAQVVVATQDESKAGPKASVQIGRLSGKAQVAVDISTGAREPVLCRVEIIPLDGSPRRDRTDGAWIIVAGYQPRLADNDASWDMVSTMCLF